MEAVSGQRRRRHPASHSRTIVIVAPRDRQSVQRTPTSANSSSASSPCFRISRSAGKHASVRAGVASQKPEPTGRRFPNAANPRLPIRVLAAHSRNIKRTCTASQAAPVSACGERRDLTAAYARAPRQGSRDARPAEPAAPLPQHARRGRAGGSWEKNILNGFQAISPQHPQSTWR